MKTKTNINNITKKINELIYEASTMIFEEIKKNAIEILKSPENKDLSGFVMGMGTYAFFYNRWDGNSSIYCGGIIDMVDDNGDFYDGKNYDDLIEPIENLIYISNENNLNCTGMPIKIDLVNGECIIKTDW